MRMMMRGEKRRGAHILLTLCLLGTASAFGPSPRSLASRRVALKAVAAGGEGKALVVQNKGGGKGHQRD